MFSSQEQLKTIVAGQGGVGGGNEQNRGYAFSFR